MTTVELQKSSADRDALSGDPLGLLAANLLRLGIRGRVQRIDISRKGELTVQLSAEGQQRWLRVDSALCADQIRTRQPELVQELKASKDHKIPLSRQLSAVESSPGMTVLSYLPHRRLVILDSRGVETEVLKGFRKGKGGRQAEKYALASGCGIPGRFLTPGPIRNNPANDYIIMPLIDGMPFKVSDERSEDFDGLGQGIAKLQTMTSPDELLPTFNRRDELEVIDERARRMRLVGCAVPEGWEQLRSRLEALLPLIPDTEPRPAHRDLHDGQLMRSAHGLALLDFDLLSLAEPELDPANFLAHLYLRRLQMPHRVSDQCVQVCGRRFLAGLGAFEREGFWARLRFYQASTFCRLQLVYSLRPRWAALTPALGRLGQRCLDDLQHSVD